MVGEPRVEHLADAGDRRLPRPDRDSGDRRLHRRIVQDLPATGRRSVEAMEHLVALVAFSFVSAVTPGPNNILLWASGAEFGFRRTIPHVIGTALGIGAMALAVAAGLGALVTTRPGGRVRDEGGRLRRISCTSPTRSPEPMRSSGRDVARPLGLLQAAAFQAINPKAWIFALGAITTFRPTGHARVWRAASSSRSR